MISFFKWVREKNTQSDEIDDEGKGKSATEGRLI